MKLIPLSSGLWSDQVGSYQYYIRDSGPATEYVNLATSYKNPADTAPKQGANITTDSTSKWNSDVCRAELIPQMTAAIDKGYMYILDQEVQHECVKCNK